MEKGSRTQFVLFPHGVDEVTGTHALVVGFGELLGSAIERATEAGADGEEAGDEGGDQIFAGTRGDDGVHGTRHSGTVVSCKHKHHLQELAGVVGEAATEPQQRHDAADSDLLFENVGDGQAGVEEFLAAVVGDGGDEGGGFADQTQFLRPRVVDGDFGDLGLG